MKKYELTAETIIKNGRTLFRIKALISFGGVAKDEKGGFIEKEANLSHKNDAWVYGDAEVYGNARVSGNAWVSGNARVSGNAEVSGNARVSKKAITIDGACQFHITVCDTTIQIGCHCHTVAEWENIKLSDAYADECASNAAYKKCIMAYEFAKTLIE